MLQVEVRVIIQLTKSRRRRWVGAYESYSAGKNCMQGFSGRSQLQKILENLGADGEDNNKMDLK